jgi:hypothetical protein
MHRLTLRDAGVRDVQRDTVEKGQPPANHGSMNPTCGCGLHPSSPHVAHLLTGTRIDSTDPSTVLGWHGAGHRFNYMNDTGLCFPDASFR